MGDGIPWQKCSITSLNEDLFFFNVYLRVITVEMIKKRHGREGVKTNRLSTVANLALMGRRFRICKMISNELLDGRDDMIFKLRWALCNPNCEII